MINRRKLCVSVVLLTAVAACAPTGPADNNRTKNSAVSTTIDPTAPIAPDRELTVVTPYRPESAQFGYRVAIERGMVFASAPGVATQSEGTVFASSYSDDWSTPESVLSSWDWRFGRDLAVRNLNAVASASETRSGLFGNRSGAISVKAAPMNSGLINSFRMTGLFAQSSDDVGRAVAISDSYVAVSAPMSGYYSTPSPYVAIGSIDASRASDNVASVGPGDVATSGSFGTSLAMTDSTLVVGAESTFGGKGSVFIYNRSGSDWTLAQRIDGSAGEAFGTDVGLVGSRIVVGAPGLDQGAVYVCDKSGANWTCSDRLAHPNTSATGARAFGQSVAISANGNEIAVGAPWALATTCCPGEAFTYELRGSAWTLTRTLRPNNPANGDSFGWSVGIEGGVAVVGSPKGAGTVSIFGTPTTGHRAPGATVEFNAPTVGNPVASRISTQGGAADGFIGSLTAWDRISNRWEVTANPSTGEFSGTWPDAANFYGSLTVYNTNGYALTSISGAIGARPTTTIPRTSTSAATPPNPTTTLLNSPVGGERPSTTAAPTPSSAAEIPAPAPTLDATITVSPPAPSSSNPRTPTAQVTATTQSKSRSTDSEGSADEQTSTNSTLPASSNPLATVLSATCQARRPCTVKIPVLGGATAASVRGAPAGLKFNVARTSLSGIVRRAGNYTVIITGSGNGRRGSATVNLSVK